MMRYELLQGCDTFTTPHELSGRKGVADAGILKRAA